MKGNGNNVSNKSKKGMISLIKGEMKVGSCSYVKYVMILVHLCWVWWKWMKNGILFWFGSIGLNINSLHK